MPARNEDLHGNAPDKSPVVLLLIDWINSLDFPEGRSLLEQALPAADRAAELRRKAREARVPTIYVNDNFGRWRSDFRSQVDHCLKDGCLGRPLVEKLAPGPDDYFVLKPKHSGFFSTTLDLLLEYLGARTLVLSGIAGNICVLFTANDAYLRDFDLCVPSDATASNRAEDNAHAIGQMAKILKADTSPTADLDFLDLKDRTARRGGPPRPRDEDLGAGPSRTQA